MHMGAHGTLEWLPGKAVALTAACFPEAMVGPLPVFYPFIVSNPGEAAQAKRRISAVSIGHLPPPLVAAGLSDDARDLERLVDEYAQADGLDRRRRERLGGLIVETARRSVLAREAGIPARPTRGAAVSTPGCATQGPPPRQSPRRPPAGGGWPDPVQAACGERRCRAHRPSPRSTASGAGAPARGAPRPPAAISTPPIAHAADATAMELPPGSPPTGDPRPPRARRCRALVIDLWGSATLRTGGEEIAHGLALMGCRPAWDRATGRVTGIEVLPPAAIGRPRIDVTWRISGLFRDLFPAQIALLDAAVRAVAAREETDDENPLAGLWRKAGESPAVLARLFGTAPGAYGAGIGDSARNRAAMGAAYRHRLAMAAPTAAGTPRKQVAARVADADLLSMQRPAAISPGRRGRRLRRCFAAAISPDFIVLDVTDPAVRARARIRPALARIVRPAPLIRASSPGGCATVRAAPLGCRNRGPPDRLAALRGGVERTD